MAAKILVLARFVLVEARRSGYPALVVSLLAVSVGLSMFVARLAITESSMLQLGMLAVLFRMTGVFLTSAFVCTSIVRESNDGGTEMLLSLPISRTVYYLGKLVGFSIFGVILAAIFSLAILAWHPSLAAIAWFISLALELTLVAAVSLFFVVTLGNIVSALASITALYVLSRLMPAIAAISAGPFFDEKSNLETLAGWAVKAVGLFLPDLDSVSKTEWLLYALPSSSEFLLILGHLLLFGCLVVIAGLFDFHRRTF